MIIFVNGTSLNTIIFGDKDSFQANSDTIQAKEEWSIINPFPLPLLQLRLLQGPSPGPRPGGGHLPERVGPGHGLDPEDRAGAEAQGEGGLLLEGHDGQGALPGANTYIVIPQET